MGWGWGPCRAGQLAYMLYRSAKVQQLMSSRGCSGLLIIPQVQRSETCAPSWRLADAGACRHMVSATPLHHRRSIQVKFHATAQHRAARTADSREHRHRSTAKASSQPLRPTRSRSPLACSGLLWRPWQLNAPPIRRVSPRNYWQAGSRHALPTAPRRATWLLTGRGEVQARRPPAELAPRRALHLHLNPGVRASTTGR